MGASRFVPRRLDLATALGLILLGALAIVGAQRFLPGETLAGLTAFVPSYAPIVEILLFGWAGVALGRFTLAPKTTPIPMDEKPSIRRELDKGEKVDRILRHIARVLQTHAAESESFSERLDGASKRLSQQHASGPVSEIVLALIEDNRDMRNRLDNVRNQLEDSRLQAMQLQTNLEKAEEAGLRDVVTAIGNRRFFDLCFEEEVEKARRTGDVFCLALADVDRFKAVNDRFGHLMGDRLLRLFASILTQNVRGQDKVARFGGEEFALIFPGARLVEAVSALERIRGILESKQWTVEPSGERVGKVTASFGVARLRDGESPNDLLQRADRLLYQAKAQGRNQVVADGVEEEPQAHSRPQPRGKRSAAG